MKKILIKTSLVISSILFSGCVTSLNNEVTVPIKTITQDKSKAYISFVRPFGGGELNDITIIEFKPKINEIELVGYINSKNKFIYPVSAPGTYYFYMTNEDRIVNYNDMIEVNVTSNKMYYISFNPSKRHLIPRVSFYPFKKTDFKDELINVKCNQELFSKYEFEKVEEEYSPFDRYRSLKLKTDIDCTSGYARELVNNSNVTVDDLKKAVIVTPNEKSIKEFDDNKARYLSEIIKYHIEFEKYRIDMIPEDGFDLD
ncbi:MAG: hypothetical protein RBQ97_10965 [Acholeplasma sp.]|nr:hypothetical protein [Acholeplasma sp.]